MAVPLLREMATDYLPPMTPIKTQPRPSSKAWFRKKTPSPIKLTWSHAQDQTPTRGSILLRVEQSESGPTKADLTKSRPLQIELDFNLVSEGHARLPTWTELSAIKSLFPTCRTVDHILPFLVFRFDELPPKPWPSRLAGLPTWFTTDDSESPLELGRGTRGTPLELPAEIERGITPPTETLIMIVERLKGMGIALVALQWRMDYFLVEVDGQPENQWDLRFPCTINKLYVGYLFGEVFKMSSALQLKEPTNAEPDDTSYKALLRPGMMISGVSDDGMELLTTSGICVKSPAGEQFVTCAAHGFASGSNDVYHPKRTGQRIGKIDRVLGTSDVALFKLEAGLKHSDTTFSLEDYEVSPFVRMTDPASLPRITFLFMNSPFNGLITGILLGVRLSLIPVDEPGQVHQYIMGTIASFGENSDRILPGCCGACVWTDDFEVVGQFRFVDTEHRYVYMPSYMPLMEQGFELSHVN